MQKMEEKKQRARPGNKDLFNGYEIVSGNEIEEMHKAEKTGKFFEMLSKTSVGFAWEMALVYKWAAYLETKNVPYIITKDKSGTNTFVRFWVYGVKIVPETV